MESLAMKRTNKNLGTLTLGFHLFAVLSAGLPLTFSFYICTLSIMSIWISCLRPSSKHVSGWVKTFWVEGLWEEATTCIYFFSFYFILSAGLTSSVVVQIGMFAHIVGMIYTPAFVELYPLLAPYHRWLCVSNSVEWLTDSNIINK